MHSILTNAGKSRGLSFHRLMAMTSLLAALLFSFFFLILYPNGNELVWDRLFLAVYCTGVLIFTLRKNVNVTFSGRLLVTVYYLHAVQTILAATLNDFQIGYFIVFFITAQVSAYSFRRISDALIYLSFIWLLSVSGIYLLAELPGEKKFLYFSLITLSCILQYFVTRVKCRFVQAMKMNESFLRSLVAKTEEGIFLADLKGYIKDANAMSESIFGYSRSELLERDFRILRKEALTAETIEEGMQSLLRDNFWNTRTELVRKDGTVFIAGVSIAQLNSGGESYLIYRVKDISELVGYEEKLLEAKTKAEAAAVAKSQFLAVMSHEIRTPLNGVIATASLLQQTDVDTEQKELVDTITKSGKSLLMLINDILEFSKMESGKMQLDLYPCSIGEIVYDVSNLLRPHSESKGLSMEISVDTTIPSELLIDGQKMRQVLLNLLGNAIKFTPKGKIGISVGCAGILHGSYCLSVSVFDTGVGIPEDKIHLLFQSFSQVDASTSRKYGGTGLGLAISKQIIELMGGNIEVKSVSEKGTTMSFYIWCETAISKADESSKVNVGKGELDKNLRIMVAEDNPINRQVFQFMLQNLGMTATYAMNGIEVLDHLRSGVFDLIFMDMQMPEMDGLKATEEIRKSSSAQPYIIGISANAYDSDINRCSAAGMNDFLPKPFDLDQLKEVIARHSCSRGYTVETAA